MLWRNLRVSKIGQRTSDQQSGEEGKCPQTSAETVCAVRGAHIRSTITPHYTPWLLRFYGVGILTLTNFFIWRCPTKSLVLPFFQSHIGENAHLDVRVGTGYFPVHSAPQFAKTENVAFLDLNPNTLELPSLACVRRGTRGRTIRCSICSIASLVPSR